MKISKYLLVAAFVTVPLAATAGEGAKPPAPPNFADIDTNADMYIDATELEAFRAAMLDRMKEHMQSNGAPRGFNRRPGDADMMLMADTDGDGLINQTEFDALVSSMQERRARMRENMEKRRQAQSEESGA